MGFHSWPGTHNTACPRRRRPARSRLFLENLEDRNLMAGGLSPSIVALGGATPLPIPLSPSLANLGLGGPDVYQNLTGPADAPPPFGNEPNGITDFVGFYGGARVLGRGTDSNGATLYWDADVRFMKGVYRGLDGNVHRGTFVET
jgi:hypothetical protein